jgi:hypothetical protein
MDFETVLVERDGVTPETAHSEKQHIISMLITGELDYEDLEDYLRDEYGLEPDYVMEFVL